MSWSTDAFGACDPRKGVPLVNIAQPFKKSGMMLTCRKDTNITKPEDFRGRTLGVWFGGNEYPFLSWMSHLKIPTEGGKDGVTVLKQGFNVDPLIQKQADCISTMTYNEYWQVIDAGIPADQLVVFPYEEQGVATLEDGLYVLEKSLDDPAMVDKLARFVRASMKGWKYASENPGKPPISCSTMMLPARRPKSPGAYGQGNRQAGRWFRWHSRRSGCRPHRGNPARRRFRSGHHQETGRRVDREDHRRHEEVIARVRSAFHSDWIML